MRPFNVTVNVYNAMLDDGQRDVCVRTQGLSLAIFFEKGLAQAELSPIPSFNDVPGEWLYFNRLIVPAPMRNKGMATALMQTLVECLDRYQQHVLLEINAYGDLTVEQLEKFYSKFGFVKDSNHGWVRAPRFRV